MKKLLTQLSYLLIALFLFTSLPSYSQIEDDQITEGTEFWFGIPHCLRDKNEPVRWGIYPIELWVSSKVDTKFKISSADGTMSGQTYTVRANEMRIVSLSDDLENNESEIISNKGIFIKADDPITVGVFTAYKWSGEAYRVIPVEWLGREYYTLNLYQDEVKMYTGYTEHKPGQILIVATQDNTTVIFTPKCDTEKGVKAGQPKQVKLNKGQTYLIHAKIVPELKQDWKTDLTGTHIKASAPIAVISGHTKGTFARYSASMFGIKADFIRNMLIEMMWPVELLGCEYISAPIKYLDRTVYGLVEDDRGDLIRFVATQDGTEIYQMRQDGTSLKKIGPTMKAGDVYNLLTMEDPAFYKSNKPVMVGQYGKAWVLNLPNPEISPKKDDLQNPSRNGQGMLLTLAPIERWTSYAAFRAVPRMDAFIYITLRSSDVGKIKYDGEYL